MERDCPLKIIIIRRRGRGTGTGVEKKGKRNERGQRLMYY
jgi:hypothetical protein